MRIAKNIPCHDEIMDHSRYVSEARRQTLIALGLIETIDPVSH